MRYSGIIILLILVGCKTIPPTASTPTYSENLSVHRPQMQSNEPDTSKAKSEEYVPITGHIRSELDSAILISVAQNKEEKLVDGFVIQVYTGNSRDMANKIWSKFDSYFPDLKPKISYHQPNFRVKAGRFTNKLKAHRIYNDVKAEFPKALLVPERFTMKYE